MILCARVRGHAKLVRASALGFGPRVLDSMGFDLRVRGQGVGLIAPDAESRMFPVDLAGMSRSRCSCARRPGSGPASTRCSNRHLEAATLRSAERPGSDRISEANPNEMEKPGGFIVTESKRVEDRLRDPFRQVLAHTKRSASVWSAAGRTRSHVAASKANDASVSRIVCKCRVSGPHCSPCAPHSDESGHPGGSHGQSGRGSVASRCRTACVAALRRRSSGVASNSARNSRTQSSISSCADSDVFRIEPFRSPGASSLSQVMC